MNKKKRYFLNREDLNTGKIYCNNDRMEFENRVFNTGAAIFILVLCGAAVALWSMGIL